MGLTDHLERDDSATLRAEDEAIRAAETPPDEVPHEDVAALIERLTNEADVQP